LRLGAIHFRKLPIVVLVMKLNVKSILLGLACLALFCAVPSAFAAGHKGSAWFSIHFHQDTVPVSDWTCLEPGGRFFTSLDTGELIQPLVKQESFSLFPWSSRGDDNSDSDSSGGSRLKESFNSSGEGLAASDSMHALKALLERTDATDVGNLQDKLFGVIQSIICAILMVFMSGFLLVFSGYLQDGQTNKSKAAIWGYVLSLDLGFVVLAWQGYWSQDRLWNVQANMLKLMPSPELVMVMLVGCAWYTFLRTQNQRSATNTRERPL
jgi:hypothetical protein